MRLYLARPELSVHLTNALRRDTAAQNRVYGLGASSDHDDIGAALVEFSRGHPCRRLEKKAMSRSRSHRMILILRTNEELLSGLL